MIRLSKDLGERVANAIEEQPKPEAVAPTPETPTPVVTDKEVPKIETPTVVEPPVNPEPSTDLEWDEETPISIPQPEVKTEQPAPVTFDYSRLGKSIGFEDVKSEDELIAKVKELPKKALEGVPESLQKAIELAKKGGDYLSYLKVSEFDYTSVEPVELFKTDLFNRVKQLNPQATKDELETRYQEALGSYAPIQQLIEGQKLQKSYTDWQKAESERIEREAVQKKAMADAKVKESIDKLEEVRGFKVKPSHKAAMYDYITSGQLQKDLFSQDGYNYEALVEIAFERKYGKKASEFLWNKAKTATKKELVKELTNAQIEKPAERLSVETKEITPLEAWLQKLRQGR